MHGSSSQAHLSVRLKSPRCATVPSDPTGNNDEHHAQFFLPGTRQICSQNFTPPSGGVGMHRGFLYVPRSDSPLSSILPAVAHNGRKEKTLTPLSIKSSLTSSRSPWFVHCTRCNGARPPPHAAPDNDFVSPPLRYESSSTIQDNNNRNTATDHNRRSRILSVSNEMNTKLNRHPDRRTHTHTPSRTERNTGGHTAIPFRPAAVLERTKTVGITILIDFIALAYWDGAEHRYIIQRYQRYQTA